MERQPATDVMDFGSTTKLAARLMEELSRVVFGAEEAVRVVVIAALSGQHLLIEDVPGVGKTMMAKGLARLLGASVSRVQGQPDLLPTDIIGVSIFRDGAFEFRKGPIFANVVLCDELNRTPPRTQAALLEAMEERQVSYDGATYPLPRPHLVIATQNPFSSIGVFPLVESQVDRFGLSTSIGYPPARDEESLAVMKGTEEVVESLEPICDTGRWSAAQEATRAVRVGEATASYAVAVVRATREHPGITLGASPRASISLLNAARAQAVIRERPFVTPQDVKDVAIPVLAHRLMVTQPPAHRYVREILDQVPVPVDADKG
jgi:MoxR-like ATPase